MKKIRKVKRYIGLIMIGVLMTLNITTNVVFAEMQSTTNFQTTGESSTIPSIEGETTEITEITEITETTETSEVTEPEKEVSENVATEEEKVEENQQTDTTQTNATEDLEKEQTSTSEEASQSSNENKEATSNTNTESDAEEKQEVIELTKDELSETVSDLYNNINLDSAETYTTKTLIVISDNQDFEDYDAIKIINYDNMYILQYDSEEATQNAYDQLKNDNTINSVEVDTVVQSTTDSNQESAPVESDSNTSINCNLTKYLYSQPIDKNEVKVAILDSGINSENKEFENRIIDLNLNYSLTGSSDSIVDDNGHGTEVASIITENTYSNVKLMPIKVTNENGKGTLLNLYLGIQAAIENEADIINISLSTYNTSESNIITSIINQATENGIIVIAAAGNESSDVKNYVPANIDSVITVGSVNTDLSLCDFSNYGQSIDYVALGRDISCVGMDGSGEKVSGTSYSAALITSMFSKMKGINESYTCEEIKSILNQYSIDLGDEGFDNFYGNGLLSYDAVLTENNSSSIKQDIKLALDINDVENWKELSDELLNAFFFYGNDNNNAYFLQNLNDEDLALIISKDTYLVQEYNESLKYYEYLLSIDLSTVSSEDFEGTSGNFFIDISGNGVSSHIRIEVRLQNTNNGSQQSATFSFGANTTNNHEFALTDANGTTVTSEITKTQQSNPDLSYTILELNAKYTIPARYHVSSASGDTKSGRMNFETYELTGNGVKTINYDYCESNTVDYITMSLYSGNARLRLIGGEKYSQSYDIILVKNTYEQSVYAEYENRNGTYAKAELAEIKVIASGDKYSWSKNADSVYEGASVNEYTVNSANTHTKSIKRNSNVSVLNSIEGTLLNGWYKGLPKITFTGSDPNLDISSVNVNNSPTAGATAIVTASEGKNTYSYHATNVNGSSCSAEELIIYADASQPINLFITGTTAWTNDKVPLTIKGQDTKSGLASMAVQYLDGTNAWTNVGTVDYKGETDPMTNATLSADKNGFYKVVATDRVGNTSESTPYQVTNIDKSAPTLEGEIKGDLKNSGWYKGDAVLNLTAQDTGGSGVKSITVNENEKAGDKRTIDVKTEGSNLYVCYATDNAMGITKPKKEITIKVDKSDPKNLSMTPNTKEWTKNPVQITVNAEDTYSGIDTIELQYTLDKDKPDWKKYKTENFAGANTASRAIGVTDNGYYRIIATDFVGYQTIIDTVLKVDNYDPDKPDANTIGIEPDTVQWVNQPTGVEVTGYGSDELSGLNTVEVWEKNDNGLFEGTKVEKFTGETSVETTNYDTHNNNLFKTRITDRAKNELIMPDEEALKVDNIDPQAPDLTIQSISSDEGYIRMVDGYIVQGIIKDSQSGYEKAVLQKLTDGVWVDTDTEYKIVQETPATVDDIEYKAEVEVNNNTEQLTKVAREKVIVTAANNIAISTNNTVTDVSNDKEETPNTTEVRKQGDTEVKIEFTVRENGTYRLKGADLVENTAYTNKEIAVNNLDGSMPEIRVEGNPTIWQNTDATITVLATDADTKIAKMTLDGETKSIEKNEKGEFYFTFDALKNQDFEVTAMDEAGNITTQTIHVTRIDKEVPTLNTEIEKSWLSMILSDNRNLLVSSKDELSGIDTVSVTNQGQKTILAEYEYEKAKSNYEGNYKIYQEGDYIVTITDQAGNSTTQTISEGNLDFSAPLLKVEGNPDIWQNTDATITVTATDEDSKIAEMTLDGVAQTIFYRENGDAYYTFIADKNQEFEATAKDESGNVTKQLIKVTKIDKEVPELEAGVVNSIEYSQLKYKGADNLSGISSIKLRLKDNAKKLASFKYAQEKKKVSDSYQILNEGKYQLIIKDNAGNVKEVPLTASFEIIDPYPPTDPVVPATPAKPEEVTATAPTQVVTSQQEPVKQEITKAEVEKKQAEPVQQAAKEKKPPIGAILLALLLFLLCLFLLLANVKIYGKTSEGEWKLLGKTRARKAKEWYVVKLSKLVRVRKETDDYKLVFSKAFHKTHEECDLIIQIDDIDYEKKLEKDSDTVYVEHR